MNQTCRIAFSWLLLACLAIVNGQASADRTFAQMERVSAGQFDAAIHEAEAMGGVGRLDTMHLHILCHAYSKTRRYHKLAPCLDALEAQVKAGDTETLLFGLDDPTPSLLLMRAQADIEMGRHAAAAATVNKALAWMAEEGDDDHPVHIELLSTLALAESFAGHPDKAREQLPRIAKAAKSFLGDDYKTTRSLALARVHMALGEYRQAYEALSSDRLFKLNAFLDNLFSGAALRGRDNWLWQDLPRAYMLARALLGMGDAAAARDSLDRLLAIPQARHNAEIWWMAQHDRGRIAEAEGLPEQAVEHYAAAAEAIEAQRLAIHTEANKLGFIRDKQEVYVQLIRALVALGRTGAAFEYVERSRSRALVDLLAGKQDWRSRGDAAEVDRLLRAQASAEEQARAQGGPAPGTADMAGTLRRLREVDPDIASLVSVSALPVGEIQSLLAPEERLVEYYLDGTDLYTFVLSRERLAVEKTRAAGLEDLVRGYRDCIQKRGEDCAPLGRRLHELLIAPLARHLDGKRLILVPHGPLHYLPFAALRGPGGYLVEQYTLGVFPSASVMRFLPPLARRGDSALLVGNPDLGNRRLNLPHAEQEVREIAGIVGAHQLLVRKAASEEALRAQAGRHAVVHLATHGDFSAARPLESALLLSPGAGQDGRLTVDEIYGLALDSDLVAMSACETGLGQVASGDDVVGLMRGFLYAGARNVLGSLWMVDDAATAELMTRFYRHRAGAGNAEALRQAQLELMARYPHPYFWAAFYLTGK